jgi:ankyrin repeat protein
MKTDELSQAIQQGDAKKVAALIDEDRSLLRAKFGNVSPILLSIYHGHPQIAQLFVERGAELTFGEACALGDRGRALELLKKDPSLLQSYSEDGFPAAGLAVFFRHPDLARELIERGADVNAQAQNPQRVGAVHAAATVGDHATMQLLLERGANPNARQQMGYTALHGAASHGDIEMARLLLKHGADPQARTDDGKTAVDVAEKHGQPAFAEWFRANIK